MKKFLLITALILGAITYPPVQAKICVFCKGDDFDKILKDNSKVIVDFYAPWCGPCKRLLPVIEELGSEMVDVLFVKVNCDEFENLARNKNVGSFPTLMAYKKGQKVATSVGYKSKTALKSWVNSVLS